MEFILITNDEKLAKYAEESDVDRIMVDLEIIGKKERQGHLSTVISDHTMKDVEKIRKVVKKAKLLVRVNPIHENSKNEIEEVIKLGADIIMLPMFKTPQEVDKFVSYIDGGAVVNLLLETPQAMVRIDDILDIKGIDEIHVGLNDLHLGMGLKFMFELLSGGIVEYLSKKILAKNIKFGFGGVGRLKEGLMLDPKLILSEHVRLNSSIVILSRDFHGHSNNFEELRKNIDLELEVRKIRDYLKELKKLSKDDLQKNSLLLKEKVNLIVNK